MYAKRHGRTGRVQCDARKFEYTSIWIFPAPSSHPLKRLWQSLVKICIMHLGYGRRELIEPRLCAKLSIAEAQTNRVDTFEPKLMRDVFFFCVSRNCAVWHENGEIDFWLNERGGPPVCRYIFYSVAYTLQLIHSGNRIDCSVNSNQKFSGTANESFPFATNWITNSLDFSKREIQMVSCGHDHWALGRLLRLMEWDANSDGFLPFPCAFGEPLMESTLGFIKCFCSHFITSFPPNRKSKLKWMQVFEQKKNATCN